VKKFRELGTLLLLSICSVATASNLPFINDDYPKALTTAKQRHLPIFVEVWAPW
jgi:hypothetical protein